MARILVVDDDDDFRYALTALLESLGHEVVTAQNGVVGIKTLLAGSFDLVMMDLIMPEKEGMESILEIRKKMPQMKIIAMSGGGRHSSTDYLRVAAVMGASTTLAKPFSRDELISAIQLVQAK